MIYICPQMAFFSKQAGQRAETPLYAWKNLPCQTPPGAPFTFENLPGVLESLRLQVFQMPISTLFGFPFLSFFNRLGCLDMVLLGDFLRIRIPSDSSPIFSPPFGIICLVHLFRSHQNKRSYLEPDLYWANHQFLGGFWLDVFPHGIKLFGTCILRKIHMFLEKGSV